MTPYYHDEWLTIFQGDARLVMGQLEPESVNCVVTSPPYWGLRDYGDDGQLGLEPTPEGYVEALVFVFSEVHRILRSDGTFWLNLGDSYAAERSGTTMPAETLAGGVNGWMPDGERVNRDRHNGYSPSRNASRIGLKHKDLVGIPWLVAFALRKAGWYLRSDIIWSKPNPMPESVTDRPTKSHEYLFLLSKSPRYYFNADAVREEQAPESLARYEYGFNKTGKGLDLPGGASHSKGNGADGGTIAPNPAGRNIRSVWTIPTAPYPGAHFATFPPRLVEPCIKAGCPPGGVVLDPFAGTGTVGMVAQSLSRRAVLIDLNADYLRQCLERNAQTPLGLA